MKKYIILLTSFVSIITQAQVTGYIEPAQSLLSEQKQITFVGTRSGEGYFSKDGKKMIYQSPRDTADLINHNGLVKVINIVWAFVEKLAFVSSSAVNYVKVEGNSGQKLEGRSFRIYLGTIPDYAQEGVKGVRISGASKNSPAEKAGIKAGDVITEFDRANIENLYDYVFALQSAKPNLPIKLTVLREGNELELEIVPLLKE